MPPVSSTPFFASICAAAACGRCTTRGRATAPGRIACVPCSPLEANSADPLMPHLLLVDDDDLFRESVSLNLSDEGYEVTSFANGRDVLAYLDHGGGADVILLDWRMPNLTGLDVLRQIRATGTTIPVIFLTV